jgi:chaperone BCS1
MIPLFSGPLFQGGMGLMAVGGALATLRSIPSRLWTLTRSKLYIHCRVGSEDAIYRWVAFWLSERPEIQKTGSLRVATLRAERGPDEDVSARRVVFEPGDGLHIMTFHGAKLWVTVKSTEPTGMGSEVYREISIKTRKKHRAKLEQLLLEACALEYAPDPTKTKIFSGDDGYWYLRKRQRARSRETLVLRQGQLEGLLGDLKGFLDSGDWYRELGIPYRRGYLLYGLPGNGKSSLAQVLAGEFNLDLYVLSLGDPEMTDEKLVQLLSKLSDRALVAIEDIDTVFHGREREAENKLTLSGLLNAIDGPLATDGRVLLMTTNHPEHLDPALIRPGRVDRQLELKNADAYQARQLFERFFPGAEGADRFAEWAGTEVYSMSTLQGHLLTHRTDPVAAATRASL